MKKVFLALCFLMSLALISFGQKGKKVSSKDKTPVVESSVTVKEVVEEINKALIEVQHNLDTSLVLKEATVTLATTNLTTGGGEIKVVVKGSGKWSQEKANTVTYHFEEPKKPNAGNKSKAILSTDIAKIIRNAAIQFEQSGKVGNLVKSKFEVEISFALKHELGGGIEFKLWNTIGFDLGGDYEHTASHKIVLVFGEPTGKDIADLLNGK